MEQRKYSREEAKSLFDYTQDVFFRRSRPVIGLEGNIRAPPIIIDFDHLESICSKFDLPIEIFYDESHEVDKNWSNFYEFLLDERIPDCFRYTAGETYPALRTISLLYEAVRDVDIPYNPDKLKQKMILHITRTRPYTTPSEGEQVDILRKSLFLTWEDLSRRSELSKAHILRIVRGNSEMEESDRHKLGQALYSRKDFAGRYYFNLYHSHRVDKRMIQFLKNKEAASFEKARLPNLEHIHIYLKDSISALFFILRNYDKGRF